ncbi:tyrosine-type recombinase/integrase [Actinocorallia lasiicapitis]
MKIGNVQFWKTHVRNDGRPKPYQVRWKVDREPFTLSYATSTLAEHFRNGLIAAANRGEHFDIEKEGLPTSMQPKEEKPKEVTIYDVAVSHAKRKWKGSAGNSRRNSAQGLIRVTIYRVEDLPGAPSAQLLRNALREWAFRPHRRDSPPEDVAATLAWLAESSPPISSLLDRDFLRGLLDFIGTKYDGKPGKPSSTARHRAVLTSMVNHAVEDDILDYDPIERLVWTPPEVSNVVDPRVVASPDQARALLVATTYVGEFEFQRGPRLTAFFACLYFAGLHPEEACELRRLDCTLPESGPGLIVLNGASTRAGSAWTDDGEKHEKRGLKHRPANTGRDVPIPPELVRILRAHIKVHGVTEDGRLFRGPHGQDLDSTRYLDVWHKARALALPPELYNSPLARRPYDLRHACLTLWLNSGVPAAEVAERAGNTVPILMSTYARCIHGQRDEMTQRIITALGAPGDLF